MALIYAGSPNYVPLNTTKTIHSKAGKIHGIIITGTAQGTITFYDNTAANGTILLVLDVVEGVNSLPQATFLQFDRALPLTFATGLTIVTSATARCFVITEA